MASQTMVELLQQANLAATMLQRAHRTRVAQRTREQAATAAVAEQAWSMVAK